MEIKRNMLKSKNLPNEYWVEAVTNVVYILNRCPTTSVRDVIAQEARSDRKHSIVHFKLFGCIAYAQVHEDIGKKLDKNMRSVFFGGI